MPLSSAVGTPEFYDARTPRTGARNSLELAVWQHRSMSRDETITRYDDLAVRIWNAHLSDRGWLPSTGPVARGRASSRND
jgi:hypothetical protein